MSSTGVYNQHKKADGLYKSNSKLQGDKTVTSLLGSFESINK